MQEEDRAEEEDEGDAGDAGPGHQDEGHQPDFRKVTLHEERVREVRAPLAGVSVCVNSRAERRLGSCMTLKGEFLS